MSSMTSAINVNVDSEIKKEATEILNDIGLNMSTAINMFLTQVIRNEGIPFEVKSRKPSKRLLKSIKEADAIIAGKKKAKTYHNISEMMKDVLNEG